MGASVVTGAYMVSTECSDHKLALDALKDPRIQELLWLLCGVEGEEVMSDLSIAQLAEAVVVMQSPQVSMMPDIHAAQDDLHGSEVALGVIDPRSFLKLIEDFRTPLNKQ